MKFEHNFAKFLSRLTKAKISCGRESSESSEGIKRSRPFSVSTIKINHTDRLEANQLSSLFYLLKLMHWADWAVSRVIAKLFPSIAANPLPTQYDHPLSVTFSFRGVTNRHWTRDFLSNPLNPCLSTHCSVPLLTSSHLSEVLNQHFTREGHKLHEARDLLSPNLSIFSVIK